jgi:hypothetical protein
VVLHPKTDTYFADLRRVCVFAKKNMHVWVRVKLLNDIVFAKDGFSVVKWSYIVVIRIWLDWVWGHSDHSSQVS